MKNKKNPCYLSHDDKENSLPNIDKTPAGLTDRLLFPTSYSIKLCTSYRAITEHYTAAATR